ncbi:MAG: hypothetical protein BGN85_01270 [Alphaproteobacteria bacterium 64-11]|nr:hypothetical protein [Alphaproteobacteria bacterium]OJU12062.1 MAG: hypothetical protein BGN85_01270 [Alphaproteobacteria bacterium 64-11]
MKSATLVLIGLLAGTGPALAQTVRQEVLDGAARCAGAPDDRTWLDCFYGSAQPMRARLGLPPAPAAQTRLVPPPGPAYLASAPVTRRAPPPKEKGFFAELLGSTRPTVSNMPMASYRFDPQGRFTVQLQNGQVYVQEASDLFHPRWSGPAGALLVTIQPSGDKYALRVKSEPGAVYHVRRR